MRLIFIAVLFAAVSPFAYAQNPLLDYLNQPDPAYGWTLIGQTQNASSTTYNIRLVSQTWQGSPWTHQLIAIVPKASPVSNHAFLFINGGTNENGEPVYDDGGDFALVAESVATQSGAVVAMINQIPNQPLYGLDEDALIAYTFDQYLKGNGIEWPALLPCTKSVIKAMDALQEMLSGVNVNVDYFVAAGASKRGWTTWLTGASQDERVEAICPIVYDNLNLAEQMEYQLEAWGAYSVAIHDYVDIGLPQKKGTPEGQALMGAVDPYSYLDELSLPKHLIIATNDQYWPLDAVRNYYGDLPGPKSIFYVANSPHELGFFGLLQAAASLTEYFGSFVKSAEWPRLGWSIEQGQTSATLSVTAPAGATAAAVWKAVSATRDFRGSLWTASTLSQAGESFSVELPRPASGYAAYYVDVAFPPIVSQEVHVCTRVYVLDSQGLTAIPDWSVYAQ